MIHPYGVVATLLLWTAQGTPLDGTWLLTRIFRGGSPATTRAVPLDSTVYIRMSLESHTGGWVTRSLYPRYFGQPQRTQPGGGPLRGTGRPAPRARGAGPPPPPPPGARPPRTSPRPPPPSGAPPPLGRPGPHFPPLPRRTARSPLGGGGTLRAGARRACCCGGDNGPQSRPRR